MYIYPLIYLHIAAVPHSFSSIGLNTSVELTECNSTNMKISVTSPLFKYIQNNISYYFGSAWPILYYNFNTTSVDEQKLLSSLFTYNYVNNWRSGTPKQNCKEDSEFCKKAKVSKKLNQPESTNQPYMSCRRKVTRLFIHYCLYYGPFSISMQVQ